MFGSRTATSGRSIWSRVAILVACLALVAAVLPATAGAVQPTARMHTGKTSITKVGTSRIAKVAKPVTPVSGASVGEFGPREENLDAKVSGSQSAARVPAAHVPAPAGQAVTTVNTGASGFDALSHAEQRFSGTGTYAGTNFSNEPPDQGLCVGNGFVVEAVNTAIAVYTPGGATLAGPTPLNQLFGVAPAIIRSTPLVFGDFVGDVRCYYDPPTQRWFVTAFDQPTDPATGAFTDESHVKLAVSKTADPRGDWWIYDLDTTDGDGTVPNHPNCPCFPDQPLIGADAYAFFISTNEYSLEPFGEFFNGAQVYAFSKRQLETGSGGSLSGLHFDGIGLEEGMAYTIQPATTPAGGTYDTARGGTAYALSALDFTATLDNRIAVWALTGTSTIGTTNQVQPWVRVLTSEDYGQPPDAEQRDGPTPLRDAEAAGLEGRKSVEHLELLAANDDRMQQTVYANGVLWSDLNTVVKPQNGNVQVGVAWFAVQPTWTGGVLGGSIANQGYVSVNRANVLYGSIAVNAAGDAAMGATLVGTSYYPSAAWIPLSTTGPAGSVHLIGAGAGPEDGFSGYRIEGGNGTARWGDYSAAVADENGDLWVANEFITSKPRSLFANWGTFITKIDR